MSKHTPGPWVTSKWGDGSQPEYTLNVIAPKSEVTIAQEVQEDDANLIAAAPDLLEALEELVDLVDDMRTGEYRPDSFTAQPARKAIAKARGES